MPDLGLLHCGPPRGGLSARPEEPGEPSPPARACSMASDVAILRDAAPAAIAIVLAASAVSPVASTTAPDSPAVPAPRESPPPPAPRDPPLTDGSIPPIALSDLLWLALALLLIIGTGLGVRDPWPADEPRFAAVARDMVLTGEWLFPRVGGDLYQDKPPVFFWMLAVCYSLTGSLKAAFLIPSFLAAGGVMFLLYDLGRRLVSRAAGLAAALLVVCTLQFALAMRGAQIDPVLCFLTTFSAYALLRHLLLGPSWRWYVAGGFVAGIGVITKGVGFLPLFLVVAFFVLRGFRWRGLATVDAGRGGWRWWLAPLAMLVAISLWFVPMLIAVATSAAPEYAAYRDEILFKQTVGRYAAAWHHLKGVHYFLLEVIPPLWIPWSLLLFWLVPRFRDAWRERDGRVWLPLSWVILVLLFFTASTGKRGIYILPALPLLAIASLPYLENVLARRGVHRVGFALGAGFFIAAALIAGGYAAHAKFAVDAVHAAGLEGPQALYVYLALAGAGLVYAWRRQPLAAWPASFAALAIVFSYFIAPSMNPERSARAFMEAALAQVPRDEELALVEYKEQFLLYLDRPIVNFGHRRWHEGPQEAYDAAAWLAAAPHRVLLLPHDVLKPCFVHAETAGLRRDEQWYLVRAPAEPECVRKGRLERAIRYEIRAQK